MKKILYISPYEKNVSATNGGYGIVSEAFKRVFDNLENINIEYLNINQIGQQVLNSKIKQYDICILLVHPSSFDNKFFKINIEYIFSFCKKKYAHIFWETIPFPVKWNWMWSSNLFDGFIASSNFILNMLDQETKKYNKKNYLIYVPLFENDYLNYRVDIEDKIKNENIFTVLYMGQYTKRKGMEDAIIGFVRSLSPFEDCQLILKYHYLSGLEVPPNHFIKHLTRTNSKDMKAHIYEVVDDLNKDQIFSLYKESSVLLFPSRGEGYGLPCIEAGMIGIPIIYTDWSAIKETAKFKGNKALDYTLDSAQGMAHYDYELNALYAVPKIKDITKYLLYYYELWKEDKEKYYINVSNNDKEIIKKFGIEISSSQIKNILEI